MHIHILAGLGPVQNMTQALDASVMQRPNAWIDSISISALRLCQGLASYSEPDFRCIPCLIFPCSSQRTNQNPWLSSSQEFGPMQTNKQHSTCKEHGHEVCNKTTAPHFERETNCTMSADIQALPFLYTTINHP